MTGWKREQLEAEWIERLRRFQKRPGNAAEFCRAEGVSMAILYRWRQRLADTVPGLVPAPGAPVPTQIPRQPASFAAVRIRSEPPTDTVLRVILPNGTRLEVPGRDPEVRKRPVEPRPPDPAGGATIVAAVRCWRGPVAGGCQPGLCGRLSNGGGRAR